MSDIKVVYLAYVCCLVLALARSPALAALENVQKPSSMQPASQSRSRSNAFSISKSERPEIRIRAASPTDNARRRRQAIKVERRERPPWRAGEGTLHISSKRDVRKSFPVGRTATSLSWCIGTSLLTGGVTYSDLNFRPLLLRHPRRRVSVAVFLFPVVVVSRSIG